MCAPHLSAWLSTHPEVDVVRFTTFFYHFTLVYGTDAAERYGEHFAATGIDAVVGSVGSGATCRMIADIPHVRYTEGRFLPYFFPDVFHPGGDPVTEANRRLAGGPHAPIGALPPGPNRLRRLPVPGRRRTPASSTASSRSSRSSAPSTSVPRGCGR